MFLLPQPTQWEAHRSRGIFFGTGTIVLSASEDAVLSLLAISILCYLLSPPRWAGC